ncbi:MAG: TetR/AcrR family transcriptional regulator [Clostridia bacterium]|nr:TetR/AcrR family transcriptional regulator [Clostridia bacterium]
MARRKDPSISKNIIETTIKLTAQKGLAKATSIEIAKNSGVTEATLFAHFQSIANLRREAYEYAEQIHIDAINLVLEKAQNIEDVCFALLDEVVKNLNYVQYSYSYELLDCTQSGCIKDVEKKDRVLAFVEKIFGNVVQHKNEQLLLWWTSKCVLLKYFAFRVFLDGDYSNTTRQNYVNIIFGDILG